MKKITKFWLACIECREKSRVNFELDWINKAVSFQCYNYMARETLVVAGTTPPVDKEDFAQQAGFIKLKKKKKIIQ